MSKSEAEIRAETIRLELHRHSHLYYVESRPEIKDSDYDLLFAELKTLELEWPELIRLKPKDRIDIFLSYSKSMTSRNVKIIGFGKWKKYKFNEI